MSIRERLDISAYLVIGQENTSRPVAVVECKALETPLNDAAFNETFDYAEKLACDYCILTNGEELYCFYLDTENYIELDSVPNYHEMIKTRQQSGNVTLHPDSAIEFAKT